MGDRQAGFSLIEAVVVVAVVGIIAACGAIAYEHYKTKPTGVTGGNQTIQNTTGQNNNQQSNTNSSNRQNSATNTFTIPELNAKLTLPDGLASTDLKYSISTDTGIPTADFTTASLEQADGTNACRASQAPIGVIWRSTQNPASGSVTVRQVGKYYYAFERPQGSCTGNVNAGKLEQSQTALLQQAFQTISTIN